MSTRHATGNSTAKKRKRAAALTASEPLRKRLPAAPVATAQTGTGIAALAQDLADISKLYVKMDRAQGCSQKAIDHAIELKDTQSDAYAGLLASNRLFERMDEHSYAKLKALEKIVIELEPVTVGEVLSLALRSRVPWISSSPSMWIRMSTMLGVTRTDWSGHSWP